MSRIASAFCHPGHKVLIAYVMAGYPDVEATLKAVPLLAESGCDLVEIGIPFSDPLADGPTIQRAGSHALA
ncbi:MAG: tryptophan synthase subunit alpha, partial [Chloroflexota bacterium]